MALLFFSESLKLLQSAREEIENERDRIFASCYGKLTTSGLCSFEFVPILHTTLLHVLCVISLSLTGTSIARKFSPGFTLSSSKVNVASRVLGALNSSLFYLTYVSVRKDYPIICVFIIVYTWVFDNNFKDHYIY